MPMCICSASLAKSAKSAAVPFQPNGFTTRSASTPRMPDASTSPFGVARRTPKSTPLLARRASRSAPARAASRTRSARSRWRSRLISRASAWTTPSAISAGGFRWSPLRVRSPSPWRNASSVSAPAPFGPPTQWHDGQEIVSGPPKSPRCTRRNGPLGGRRAAAEPVGEVVLVLEEELAAIRELREANLAGGDAARVERGVHGAEERARRRRLADAELVAALRPAMRVACGLEAERCRPLGRRAIGSPARGVLRCASRPAAGDRQANGEHRRRAPRGGAREPSDRRARRHGTKSFGWRESDARKTRTLARASSSSARYASRAAAASPPCSTIASCTVGARPSWR